MSTSRQGGGGAGSAGAAPASAWLLHLLSSGEALSRDERLVLALAALQADVGQVDGGDGAITAHALAELAGLPTVLAVEVCGALVTAGLLVDAVDGGGSGVRGLRYRLPEDAAPASSANPSAGG